MFRNRFDPASRWWLTGSVSDPASSACASSTLDPTTLRTPIPLLLKDGKRPSLEGSFKEWIESGSSPEDEGRVFEIASMPRRLLLYQPRKSETNQVRSLDLAIYFPCLASIQEIRMGEDHLLPLSEIHQGSPLVIIGRENAFAVRVRATHPDLRRIPLRIEESTDFLLLVLHLVDFGKDRQLRDEELRRYSVLVTLEEKQLNNPRALEGFEHDLANQEIWDDFSGQVYRRAGFIGNGFKLTATINQNDEEWVDKFVVGPHTV